MNHNYHYRPHTYHRQPGWLLLICLAIAAAAIYFWLSPATVQSPASPSAVKQPSIIKLFIAPNLLNDAQIRLSVFRQTPIQTQTEISQANTVLTDNPTSITSGFDQTVIYSQSITIVPAALQPILSTNNDYDIILASRQTNLTKPLTEFLKQNYAAKPPPSFTILAVGDIMLSRHVGTKIRAANDTALPFRSTADILKQADITFANLESPFYDQGSPVTEGMVFKAEPNTIAGLTLAGIDIVSLANNHFGNQGQKGMHYTFNWLKEKGIGYTGAGENLTAAHTPWIKEINGKKIAFLAYTDSDVYPSAATANKAGSAIMDSIALATDIAQARQQADLIIISMHSGTEYTADPNSRQKDFARAAIDAGADLIIGHHPHVVQAMEVYRDRLISYSLGNFVFDQMWSTETTQGLVATYTFMGSKLIKAQFDPVKIRDYNQPYFLNNNPEAQDIINRILTASQKLTR